MHRSIAVSLVLLAVSLVCPVCEACTIFSLTRNGSTVFGQNLDWDSDLPSMVLINKRGVSRKSIHWKGWYPAQVTDEREPVYWTAKYGSVTFSYLGPGFIEGGMNEAGLVIDQANLGAKYPPDDGNPAFSCSQWMQYQLDNFSTVREVVEHIGELRLDGEGWHFLLCDRSGDACAIEYPDGRPLIYRGESLLYPVLTNTRYMQAVEALSHDRAFGGEADIASGTDSYGRFVRVAALMKDYPQSKDCSSVEYAFRMLDEVRVDDTQRSVVYDPTCSMVYWKTAGDDTSRCIDIGRLDLRAGTPIQMIPAGVDMPGPVNELLEEYDIERIRAVARELLLNITTENGLHILESRGYTLDDMIDLVLSSQFN